jgi:hypothetical protein
MEESNADLRLHSTSPLIFTIDGSVMKALKIACDEFGAAGGDMRDFDITIAEKIEQNESKDDADGILIVTFMGKLLPRKRGLGTANRIPGSITYFISKEKFKIIKAQEIK